jgi:hypothetical protein
MKTERKKGSEKERKKERVERRKESGKRRKESGGEREEDKRGGESISQKSQLIFKKSAKTVPFLVVGIGSIRTLLLWLMPAEPLPATRREERQR